MDEGERKLWELLRAGLAAANGGDGEAAARRGIGLGLDALAAARRLAAGQAEVSRFVRDARGLLDGLNGLAERGARTRDDQPWLKERRVRRLLGCLNVWGEHLARSGDDPEVRRLIRRLEVARQCLPALPTTAEVTAFEVEVLRPLGERLRDVALAPHLTLARPAWRCPPVLADGNTLLCIGSGGLGRELAATCRARELRLLDTVTTPEALWDGLRRAAIVVLELQDETAAAAAHVLGLALALGRRIVVVARDAAPVEATGADLHHVPSARQVAAAVEALLYDPPPTPRGNSRIATMASLATKLASTTPWMEDEADSEELLALAAAPGLLLLRPAWPGAEPVGAARTLCACLPGEPALAEVVGQVLGRHRIEATAAYRRIEGGDLAQAWDAIARSSDVLLDLTGLAPLSLACLGMAQALGRRLLVMCREEDRPGLPQAIPADLVHGYAVNEGGEVQLLDRALYRFLAG